MSVFYEQINDDDDDDEVYDMAQSRITKRTAAMLYSTILLSDLHYIIHKLSHSLPQCIMVSHICAMMQLEMLYCTPGHVKLLQVPLAKCRGSKPERRGP